MAGRKKFAFQFLSSGRVALAGLVICLLLVTAFAQIYPSSASATEQESANRKLFPGKLPITELTEDEAILHALNRLGFGPRPGDVERVRAMGLEKWIDEQLNPQSIPDA